MPLSRILTACLHFQFLKDQKQFYWLKIYQVQYIIILNRLHHVTYRYSRNNVSGNVHKNIIQHPHSRYKAETQAVQTSSVNNHYSIITKISDHKYLEVKNNYNNYDCTQAFTIMYHNTCIFEEYYDFMVQSNSHESVGFYIHLEN